MYQTSDDFDISIFVGQGTDARDFRAHTVVLRARSPYFHTALSAAWMNTENGNAVFKKPNLEPEVFEVILRYLYTGTISTETLDGEKTFKLLLAADEMELGALAEHLQDHVIEGHKHWIKDNIVQLLNISSQHNTFSKLQEYCQDLVAISPQVMLASADYITTSTDVLTSFLKREDLAMDEFKIWDHVIRWAKAQNPGLPHTTAQWSSTDFNSLKESLKDIISLIRFVDISSTDFYNKVFPYRKALPKDLYHDILHYHLEPGYEPTVNRLPQRKPDSTILNGVQARWIAEHIKKMHLDGSTTSCRYDLNLLTRGSRDGFKPSDFHRMCDNKGATVTIARVKGTNEILGGYNPFGWRSTSFNGHFQASDRSFIFSLYANLKDAVYSPVRQSDRAIYNSSERGPSFGSEDLVFFHRTNSYACEDCQYEKMHMQYNLDLLESFLPRNTKYFKLDKDAELILLVDRQT